MEGRLALRPTGLFVQIAGVITGRQIHLRSAQVPCFHLPPSPPNPSPPTVPQAAAITDKYEFMVLPFVANINMEQGANEAATQLQAVINQQNNMPYDFIDTPRHKLEVDFHEFRKHLQNEIGKET